MKNLIKRTSFLLILLLSVAFVQVAEAQQATEYEYATFTVFGDFYSISYPDGTSETRKIEHTRLKNLEESTKTRNDVFNMLAKKGYELVTGVSIRGADPYATDYIFKRPKNQ